MVDHTKLIKKTPRQQIAERKTMFRNVPHINHKELQKFCRAKYEFFDRFGQKELTPNGPLWFQDNGSNVLAIGHADTVQKAHHYTVLNLSHDKRIYCPTLDNRLGLWAILRFLPEMDIIPDVLITTGEEKLQSSAFYFEPPKGKKYNWMFSLDRAGLDVTCYDYFDFTVDIPLKRAGWKHNYGTYSDIRELEHLRIKGFNFGNGSYGAHSLDAFVSEKDFILCMKRFNTFFKENAFTKYSHTPKWNIWTPEDGFGFLYKKDSIPYQDTFTEYEIELIEQFEYEGLEFGSRLTPESIKEIIKDRQRVGLPPSPEPSLFTDLEIVEESNVFPAEEVKDVLAIKGPIKIVKNLPMSFASRDKELQDMPAAIKPVNGTDDQKSKVGPSEDDQNGSLQLSKAGHNAMVLHFGSLRAAEKKAEEEQANGKQTVGPIIHTIESPNLQDQKLQTEVKKIKGRIVSFIPMQRVTDENERYEYIQDKEGKWSWNKLPTRRKLKITEVSY